MKLCFCDNVYKKIVHERFKDFIILGIAAMVMCVIFFRGTQYASISAKDYEEINLTDCLGYVKGYETEDFKNFKVIEEDPQLMFDFSKPRIDGAKVKCILFELGQEIAMPSVHIYYGRDTTDLSEHDSEGIEGEYGKEIEVCSMKSIEGFKYLRLDVNQDFIIENVKVAYDYQLVWSNQIIGLVVLIAFGIGSAILCTANNKLYDTYLSYIKMIKRRIENNVGDIFKALFLILIMFCVILFFEYCMKSGEGYLNPYIAIIVTAIISIILGSVLFKELIWENAHIYYFVVCMMAGTVTIVALPAAVGMGADDEIHYSYVENLSWGASGKVTAAAAVTASVYSDFIQNGEMYGHETRCEWEDYLNQLEKHLPVLEPVPAEVASGRDISITSVAYIPGAIGLIVGRGIGLNYTSTFRFGKWMNLLCYVALFSCAVKMTKGKGKTLIAVIGMIPTNFYMACSYSYDWWVTSFIVFGYAFFVREIMEDRSINIRRLTLIMIIMVVGILPKAIYFSLIFPMLFVRKEKLQDNVKQRILIIATMLFLIGTFMLPRIFGGAGTGDSRGGSDVNSAEQIRFIIENPVQYTKILLNFLKSYLSPDNANRYLTYFMYYGQAQYYTVCLIVIAIVTAVDNAVGSKEIEYSLPGNKLIMTGTCFITVSLVATALYISFTAVGRDTIAGCQPRYILPVLFPFLYFGVGLKVDLDDSVKKNLFLVSMNVMMFIYLYGIYLLRVKYF